MPFRKTHKYLYNIKRIPTLSDTIYYINMDKDIERNTHIIKLLDNIQFI